MQCNETGKSQSYYYCQMTFLLIKKPWLNHSTKKMVSKRPNSLKKLNRRYRRFPKKAGQVEIGFQTVLFHKGCVWVFVSVARVPHSESFSAIINTHTQTLPERERERERERNKKLSNITSRWGIPIRKINFKHSCFWEKSNTYKKL